MPSGGTRLRANKDWRFADSRPKEGLRGGAETVGLGRRLGGKTAVFAVADRWGVETVGVCRESTVFGQDGK